MSPLALWTGLILAAGGAYAARADAGPDAAPIPAEAQVVRDLDLRVSVADTPSDDGSSLTLRWTTDPAALAAVTGGAAPDTLLELQVERRTAEAREFTAAGRARCTAGVFEDAGLQPGASYTYRVGIVAADSVIHYSADAPPAAPRANLFRKYRLNALVITLLMSALVVGFIMAAKRGANLYIRRIAGLDAIDEAVGRATEMGRKILYIPGIISVSEPQTLASLGILGYVAKLAARYGTQLEVPNIDPLTMAAAREIVKEAYLEAGAPESFREEMVHYITADQFAYAAAVNGIMVRDRPAANFLLGWFAAESLLLSETGQSIGAIQIAGTAQVTQLPFFVAACDYTMLGEELFAASAYLSKDPLILGSVKGQDMMKAAILLVIVLGIILTAAGAGGFVRWFSAL